MWFCGVCLDRNPFAMRPLSSQSATETIQNTDNVPSTRQAVNLSVRAFIILAMVAELQDSAVLIESPACSHPPPSARRTSELNKRTFLPMNAQSSKKKGVIANERILRR